MLAAAPLISEFLAINNSPNGLKDGDGELNDWLELHNAGDQPLELAGWRLRDSGNEWVFPQSSQISPVGNPTQYQELLRLSPGEYLVLMASGKGGNAAYVNANGYYLDSAGYLHTNFSLRGSGEYLGLLNPAGVVVHEYDEYPGQATDISYGIAQDVEQTLFVAPGATARYFVPAGAVAGWTGTGFDHAAWPSGPTGLGYVSTVPGFAVWNYKANTTVGNLATALQVAATPGMQSGVFTANPAVVNYSNDGGVAGHYTVGEVNFPGFLTTGMDNFVVEAKAYLRIPAAGAWTFGVNSDDGFQLTITGATTTAVANSSTPLGSDTISYYNPRGASDTLGAFNFPAAGTYEMRLVFYEQGGGSSLELFARQGATSAWDANFYLVGAAGAGRPEVTSRPIGQTGGSQMFNLVATSVESQLKNVNPSLLVRVPFDVVNPAQYHSLTLRMKYDDGFVAYLNGYEVARRNAPGTAGQALAWNAAATAQRSDAEAAAWETIDLTPHLGRLLPGANVLAIQGLNYAAGDNDFLVLPELSQIVTLGLGEHFFAAATPGDANSQDYWLHVEDTKFSLDRGFYERLPAGQNYSLEITTATPGATIRYTLDGSAPTETYGTIYTGPIPFNKTTTVRAAAFRPLYASSNVDSQTYVFFDDVMGQPVLPAGFPADWNGTAADYEMDADVLRTVDPQVFRDALRSIPTMSIVMDTDDLFNPSTGIYVNPGNEGEAWERPTSLEYFDPLSNSEFQIDAGLRIYGGAFRGFNLTKKKSFRVLFKAEYGDTKLRFPLFGEGAADEFDSFILRGGSNDGWNFWGADNTQYIVDEYMRRTQLALGGPASHGTFVHLYINGMYWGLYNPLERPDGAFASTYFGGDKENWDGVHDGVATSGGSTATWNALLNFVRNNDMTTMAAYQQVQGNNPDGTPNPAYDDLLDMENYIAYMFSNIWGGTGDWPWHNWYTACQRPPNETGFKFFNWDSEGAIIVWSGLTTDVTGVFDGVAEMYNRLKTNPEFRMRFADLAHRYLFNGGPATAGPSHDRYAELASFIEQAILMESARWGDMRGGNPYTKAIWESRRDYVLNTYMPQRPAIVLNQLRNAGLYPSVVAPEFRVNGLYQHGGPFNQGAALSIAAPAGTIYYTTDGTDPRLLGGGTAPGALVYSAPVTLNSATHVKSRVYSGVYPNGTWSALNEATFYVDLAPHLRVTEIMYHPAAPSATEIAHGFADADAFEFIELKNISTTTTVPLGGLRFSNGVDFSFPAMTLGPGQTVLVVKNQAAFRERYPAFAGTIAGQYQGSLSNGGERIVLDVAVGGVVQDFEYKDGWYGHTDGEGFSLTIRDPLGAKTLWSVKEGWRASEPPGGTPGTDDAALGFQPVVPGTIVINEVLSHSDMPYGDAIELRNVGTTAVNVSGWFLSDQKADVAGNSLLTKYAIPATPPIQPGAYLVFYGNTHFGAVFALSELGDDLYLSSNAAGVAGGYREHVDFGAAPRNVPFGLHVKSTDETDFTLLSALTLGADNAPPYLEDLVINEVMYHSGPPTAEEVAAGTIDEEQFDFLELRNTSTTASYDLREFYLTDGIGFSFGWYNADEAGRESWTLEAGATAAWNAVLPPGQANYEVFARWDLLDLIGRERNLDGQASYAITYASGSAVVVRDQQPELDDEGPDYMDANGWVSLGTYAFAGSGRVVLTRGSDNPANWTIADQVKFVNVATQAAVVVDNPVLDSWFTAHASPMLGPGQHVVLVRNYAAFDARYHVAVNGIRVAGAYSGSLGNDGEHVKLFRMGDPEANGYLPYYRADHVNYGDVLPWPVEADGAGYSLIRRRDAAGELYGNDPANWDVGNLRGTPGGDNLLIDRTPPSVPQGLAVRVTLNPTVFALTWDPSQDAESAVDHYLVYRDGELLTTTTTTAYNDTNVVPVVTYRYSVAAVNRDGFATAPSTEVSVAVPGVSSYAVPDGNHIELLFSEALNPGTAGVLTNYSIGGATIVGLALSQGNKKVALTTVEPLIIGNTYLVTASGVTTASGNQMPDPIALNVYYEPRGSGSILREYWTGIGGSAVANLTGNANYPNSPSGQSFPTLFEGPVNWNDSYGTRFRGYVHPPVSGAYTFWIASDDNSQLFLSTDANPANKVVIASVSGATGPRQFDNSASQRSAAITLSAGRKYYIEALHKDGGGNDNIAVRWQLPGGVWENAASPTDPIPGTRLSPYAADTAPPTADILDVAPDPRAAPINQVTFVFSEEVTGFDLADLQLTRDGGPNLLTAEQTLTTTNNVSFVLGNLDGLTAMPGSYALTLAAPGSNIGDLAGNAMAAGASDAWMLISDAPMVWLEPVAPDPRNTAVAQLTITFSEQITGFELADLRLTRDGGPNLLTAAQPLTTSDNVVFTLENLAGLTGLSGAYALTLAAPGSNIRDLAGNDLYGGATESWMVDSQAPTAQILAVTPDPREALVDKVTIVFSEPIAGLDLADLRLTRDGGPNLLTGTETLTATDNVTWTLGGLAKHTATGGGGAGSFVAFNDQAAGPTTHVNTTTYMANGTASGVTKDIATGAATGVTLTTSHSGAVFDSKSSNPAAGTPAYQMFNGYVDFFGAAEASIELPANAFYLHDFSGLDPGDVATYKFHGTGIRGNAAYTSRWAKVTLVGAVAATADHSQGAGIVVINDTTVALWTGGNAAAGQGFVVGWKDIDPGPDGQFSVRTEQYTGAVPVSIDAGGLANGSKAYGLSGVRLEAVTPSQLVPGQYVLTLAAAGSGVHDALGNLFALDASETFTIDTQPPHAVVGPVAPNPHVGPVDAITIAFDEPVTGFDLADLALTLDGGANLLTAAQSLTTTDSRTWILGDLGALTAARGNYALALTAAGAGIADLLGHPLATDASTTWVSAPGYIPGTPAGDVIRIVCNAADSAKVDVFVNNPGPTPTETLLRANVPSWRVVAGEGDDEVTIDLSRGNPIAAGGVFFDGEGQTAGDRLRIVGSSGNETLTATTGQIAVLGAGVIQYGSTEFFSFDLGAGQDDLTVNGALLRLGASGVISAGTAVALTGGGSLDLGLRTHTVRSLSVENGSIMHGALSGTSYAAQEGSIGVGLNGAGGFTKTGAGTVTLSAASFYLGATAIQSGTVLVTNADALSAGRDLTIGAGATVLLPRDLVLSAAFRGLTVPAAAADGAASPQVDAVDSGAGWLGQSGEVAKWGRNHPQAYPVEERVAVRERVPISQSRSVAPAAPARPTNLQPLVVQGRHTECADYVSLETLSLPLALPEATSPCRVQDAQHSPSALPDRIARIAARDAVLQAQAADRARGNPAWFPDVDAFGLGRRSRKNDHPFQQAVDRVLARWC
jgi:autotransporter-associated beta strand protein